MSGVFIAAATWCVVQFASETLKLLVTMQVQPLASLCVQPSGHGTDTPAAPDLGSES